MRAHDAGATISSTPHSAHRCTRRRRRSTPIHALQEIPPGAVVISLVPAGSAPDLVPQFAARGVTTLALERVPRITRAQSMDILSSQATVAGYKAADRRQPCRG